MKTFVSVFFVFSCAALALLFAQRPKTPSFHRSSLRQQPIRMGIDFGHPAKNCQGRGALCRIQQIAEKSLFMPPWAEAEGRLYLTRSGHFELDILKDNMQLTYKDGLSPLNLPVFFQPDSLPVELVLPESLNSYPQGIVLPPGRYYLVETESRYILQW